MDGRAAQHDLLKQLTARVCGVCCDLVVPLGCPCPSRCAPSTTTGSRATAYLHVRSLSAASCLLAACPWLHGEHTRHCLIHPPACSCIKNSRCLINSLQVATKPPQHDALDSLMHTHAEVATHDYSSCLSVTHQAWTHSWFVVELLCVCVCVWPAGPA